MDVVLTAFAQRIYVQLEADEREALVNLAEVEKRNLSLQASFIIREYLEQHGLIQSRKGKSVKQAPPRPKPPKGGDLMKW